MSEHQWRKIKICDRSFAHSNAIGSGDYPWQPQFFEWDREDCEHYTGPVVFTDFELDRAILSPASFKIALLLESRALAPKMFRQIRALENSFNLILTHDAKLLGLHGKYRFCPFGGCWIAQEDSRIYPKDREVSIIASEKRQTGGHKLRHKVIAALGNRVDVYGRGYRPVEHKLEALAPYRYSIVIENVHEPNYFTEKVVDCFATGTIPIYWGCPNIGNFFDENGIIPFKNLRDLRNVLNDLGESDYQSRSEARQHNLELVPRYRTPEDWMWTHYFSKLTDSSNASSPTQMDIAR